MTTTFTNHSPTHKIHQNPRTTNLPHKWSAPDKSSTLILCIPGTTVWNTRPTNWHTPYVQNAHENVWKTFTTTNQTMYNLQQQKPTDRSDISCGTHAQHLQIRLAGCQIVSSSRGVPHKWTWQTSEMKNHEWTHIRHNSKNKYIPRNTVEKSALFVPPTQEQLVNRTTTHHTMETRPHVVPTCSMTTRTRKNALPEMLFFGWNHSLWIAINFSSRPQSQKFHTKPQTTSSQYHPNSLIHYMAQYTTNPSPTIIQRSRHQHGIGLATYGISPTALTNETVKNWTDVTCQTSETPAKPSPRKMSFGKKPATTASKLVTEPTRTAAMISELRAHEKNACFAQCPMHTRSATELVVAVAPRLGMPNVTGKEIAKMTSCSIANHSQYTHEPSKLKKNQSIRQMARSRVLSRRL